MPRVVSVLGVDDQERRGVFIQPIERRLSSADARWKAEQ